MGGDCNCNCNCNLTDLEHIGTFVSDLERSKKFYCEVLGFKFIEDFDVEIPAGLLKTSFVQLGNLLLHLEQLPDWDPDLKDSVFAHICINVKDIKSAIENLKSKGVEFDMENTFTLKEILGGNMECIFFRGPDNESIELCERC
jgi:catechol 2,3-dioxygenase-like lactoylglutathione lyase family enzyme